MNRAQRWRWETFRDAEFVRKTLILFGLGALAVLIWQIADVLLLAFGAILIAVILRALADILVTYLHVPARWGLLTATLLIFVLVAGLLVLFGAQIRGQLADVAEQLPHALENFSQELGLGEFREGLPGIIGSGTTTGFLARIAGIGGMILIGLADLILVVIAGLYIAASPDTYKNGFVRLFPPSQRERIANALDATGRALKLWLVSQLLAMTCVGLLSAFALWLIGVPSAFALGLIAGLVDFIPFIGPFIGAVPAVLMAFTVGGWAVLWTMLAFLIIQQIEGNIIFPLIERQVVSIPPALALFAILAAGAMFGTLGIVFGFPLAVVAFVLVKRLYVRETLGDPASVPGDEETEGPRK